VSLILKDERQLAGSSPFSALLANRYDESAWLSIFGEERLSTRVCTVIVRVSCRASTRTNGGSYEQSLSYRRRALAYC
jgi:hypothetical protein